MTVNVYKNTDVGAPALVGTVVGSMLNLLSKCLVEGYGSKVAAGWSKPYTGTNIAVFKQGAGGNDRYLRVDDTSTATSYTSARVRGYETMSDLDTGTGPFPSESYVAGGGYWYRQYNSTLGNASARSWVLVADETFFYLFLDLYPGATGISVNGYQELCMFGDYNAYGGASDAYSTLLSCRIANNFNPDTSNDPMLSYAALASANAHVFAPRRWDQTGSCLRIGFHGSYNASMAGYSDFAYPNPVDGRLITSKIYIHDASVGTCLRGELPGVVTSCNVSTALLSRYDTFEGAGDLAGRSFIVTRQGNTSLFIETSDTWTRF